MATNINLNMTIDGSGEHFAELCTNSILALAFPQILAVEDNNAGTIRDGAGNAVGRWHVTYETRVL